MSRALALRLAIAAAVVALSVAGFYACFEKREVEVASPASAEAHRNRLLALGRLLERMGHPVRVERDFGALRELPPPPATVFLTSNRLTLGRAPCEALLDWVARGGHLVVVTYTVWRSDAGEGERIVDGKPDLLLDRFGLRQRLAIVKEPEREASKTGSGGATEPAAKSKRTRQVIPDAESSWAYLEDSEEPFELEFSRRFWWDDTRGLALFSVAGNAGAHLVEIAHGRGRISALTSDEPLVNDTIGRVDHAAFLVRWLRDGRETHVPVWIFTQEDWPSLFALTRQYAMPALAGAAAVLLSWLWRSLWRFGPALPAPDPARRRWLEHLEATGRFHWRQDRGAALLGALRADFARELERKRPAWARLPERERIDRLARASGLSREEVTHAQLDSARAQRAFSAAVRSLERMRAAL